MLKKIVLVFATLALAKAQIPSLGWCPEYVPMAKFDVDRYLGQWFEAERYFQLTELVSRCLTSNYSRGPDGKIHVSNEVTNRITGVKRVLDGEVKPPASKSEVGKLIVKYTTVPLAPETQYSVLDTDYDNFAVLWSCSSLGLVHAQNAWVMTRERSPSPEVLEKAYGVLDKFGIWKRYFVKTDQTDCTYEVPKVPEKPAAAPAPAPAPAPVVESPAPVKEPEVPVLEKSAEHIHLRSTAVQSEAEVIDEAKKEEPSAQLLDAPTKLVEEPVKELPAANVEPAKEVLPEEKPVLAEVKPEDEQSKAAAPEGVPEVILKVAQSVNEADAAEKPLVSANPVAEESKTVEVAVLAESKPNIAALLPEAPEETPKVVEAAAESVENPKIEAAPIEEPIQSAEQPEPVEPVAEVSKSEIVEIERPLEVVEKIELPAPVVLPESPATQTDERIVPIEAAEEIKIAEVPAVLPESAPVDPTLVKTSEVPKAEEPELVIPESAEPANIPEGGEQLLRKVVPAAVPETILAPAAVQETPVAPDAQPLKTIADAAEEPKIEVTDGALKTFETKL